MTNIRKADQGPVRPANGLAQGFDLACLEESMVKECPNSNKTSNQQEKLETRADSYFSYHHNLLLVLMGIIKEDYRPCVS